MGNSALPLIGIAALVGVGALVMSSKSAATGPGPRPNPQPNPNPNPNNNPQVTPTSGGGANPQGLLASLPSPPQVMQGPAPDMVPPPFPPDPNLPDDWNHALQRAMAWESDPVLLDMLSKRYGGDNDSPVIGGLLAGKAKAVASVNAPYIYSQTDLDGQIEGFPAYLTSAGHAPRFDNNVPDEAYALFRIQNELNPSRLEATAAAFRDNGYPLAGIIFAQKANAQRSVRSSLGLGTNDVPIGGMGKTTGPTTNIRPIYSTPAYQQPAPNLSGLARLRPR